MRYYLGTHAFRAHGNLPLPSKVCHAPSLQWSVFFSAYSPPRDGFVSSCLQQWLASQTTLWFSPKAFPKGTHNWQKRQNGSVHVSKLIGKLLPQHLLEYPLVIMASDFSLDKTKQALGIYYQRVSRSFFFFFNFITWKLVLFYFRYTAKWQSTIRGQSHIQWRRSGLVFPTKLYQGWASPGR